MGAVVEMEFGRRPLTSTAPRKKELHNLFFALVPDAHTRERIAAQARWLNASRQPDGRWIKPQRYHLTLQFLGTYTNVPIAPCARVRATAGMVDRDAFNLRLNRVGSFRNGNIPWWLGCEIVAPQLLGLASDIAAISREAGFAAAEHALLPHVTVLRDASAALETTSVEAIDWKVDEFCLIDSVFGSTVEHIVIERWPLRRRLNAASNSLRAE